ncbi:hypothetical protein [Nocardioides sp. SYSU D00038]|uniref:hypothetical protein n=1 Tax=Nocardioides sp. SYSU D00038 TaxID=2812554 RepID=UPI0019672C27|nr:hypothetical protein [Nocardioides sp. SYSU D00038]
MTTMLMTQIPLAQIPATTSPDFGMPICGHAFPTSVRVLEPATQWLARDRKAASVKGDMGFAPAYDAGPSAWRPPTG